MSLLLNMLSRLVITFLPRSKRLLISQLQSPSANITVIQVYAPTINTEEAEVEQFYEDLQDLLELTPKKDVLFIIRTAAAKLLQSCPTLCNPIDGSHQAPVPGILKARTLE